MPSGVKLNSTPKAAKAQDAAPAKEAAPEAVAAPAAKKPVDQVDAPRVKKDDIKVHMPAIIASAEIQSLVKAAAAHAGAGKVEPEHIVLALLESKGKAVDKPQLLNQAKILGDANAAHEVDNKAKLSLRSMGLLVNASAAAGDLKNPRKLEHLEKALGSEEGAYASIYLDAVSRRDVAVKAKDARPVADRFPKLNAPTLAKLGSDMTMQAAEGLLDPVVGRDKEIELVMDELSKKDISSLVITAPKGVGKTAIAAGLAQRIADGDAPGFENARIISLPADKLECECNVCPRGAQQVINDLLGEIEAASKKNPPVKVVLFMDEIHRLPMAIAQQLKPYLTQGKIRIVGATTTAEYKDSIAKDGALADRLPFQEIKEPTIQEAWMMVKAKTTRFLEFFGMNDANNADVDDAIQMSLDNYKHISDANLPRGPIDVLDSTFAAVKRELLAAKPRAVRELEKQIDARQATLDKLDKNQPSSSRAVTDLAREKVKLGKDLDKVLGEAEVEKGLLDQRFGFAEELSKLLDSGAPQVDVQAKKAELDAVAKQIEALPRRHYHPAIDGAAVASLVSRKSGLSLDKLRTKDGAEDLSKLEEKLNKKVKGQERATGAVAKAIRRRRTGVSRRDRPVGVMFFPGLTGTGKTELAKTTADVGFGKNIIRLNGNQMMHSHELAKIVGAPPGYVGFQGGSQLANELRKYRGNCVVLIDEIEKAHPDIWKVLMTAFDEGTFDDNVGDKVDCKDSMFILTSNLGANIFAAHAQEDGTYSDYGQVVNEFFGVYKATLPPEVVGRLAAEDPDTQGVYIFNPLGKQTREDIVDVKILEKQKDWAKSNDWHVEVTEDARGWMMERGFDPEYGGRSLNGVLRKYLEDTMTELVMDGQMKAGEHVTFDVGGAADPRPLDERVASIAKATAAAGLGDRVPNDIVAKGKADLRSLPIDDVEGQKATALVDEKRERFFVQVGDGKDASVYGPFAAPSVQRLKIRPMTMDERAAYMDKVRDAEDPAPVAKVDAQAPAPAAGAVVGA